VSIGGTEDAPASRFVNVRYWDLALVRALGIPAGLFLLCCQPCPLQRNQS
jgi:hypothetical protein